VVTTIAAPILLGNDLFGNHPATSLVVDGFLLLILACNTYRLVQYSQLKQVRSRLSEQF
jgi:hypothetical protein